MMIEEALGSPIDCNYIEQISKRTCNFLRELLTLTKANDSISSNTKL